MGYPVSEFEDDCVALHPGTDDPIVKPTPRTIGWHRCRLTLWGDPVAVGGAFVGFTGTTVWWQERRCVKCNAVHRRKVTLT